MTLLIVSAAASLLGAAMLVRHSRAHVAAAGVDTSGGMDRRAAA